MNYAARAAGVRRMDKITVALQKCPDLVAVHVKTIDCDDASLELLREDARDGVSISEDEVGSLLASTLRSKVPGPFFGDFQAVSSDLPDTTVKSLEGPWRPDRKNAKVRFLFCCCLVSIVHSAYLRCPWNPIVKRGDL